DAAARRMRAREAGQERLVMEHRAFGALAEAVEPIEGRRILAGDLVALLDALLRVLELGGVERGLALLAGCARVRRRGGRLGGRRGGEEEQSRGGREETRRTAAHDGYLSDSMISSRAAFGGRRRASGIVTSGSPVTPESSRKSFLRGSA